MSGTALHRRGDGHQDAAPRPLAQARRRRPMREHHCQSVIVRWQRKRLLLARHRGTLRQPASSPFVEIGGKKPYSLIREHRIDARGEIRRFSGQMRPHHIVAEPDECLVWTFSPSDPRLPANIWHPFIAAHRRITGLPGLLVFPPSRKHIFLPSEK